ncbi:hypothetical protein Agub_g8139, partial [Astrephomene gubernaculifera]
MGQQQQPQQPQQQRHHENAQPSQKLKTGWPEGASHYEVLGVPFGASQEEIRVAYRTAARLLHPDKGGSAAAFSRLQAAWEVLRRPDSRAVYDRCSYDYRQQ